MIPAVFFYRFLLCVFPYILMITIQEFSHPVNGIREFLCSWQHDNPEMVWILPVESTAWNKKDVCGMKQISDKLLIVSNLEFPYIQLWENIERTVIFHKGDSINLF